MDTLGVGPSFHDFMMHTGAHIYTHSPMQSYPLVSSLSGSSLVTTNGLALDVDIYSQTHTQTQTHTHTKMKI